MPSWKPWNWMRLTMRKRRMLIWENFWLFNNRGSINTEFPGNQKHTGKIQGIVMSWEKILSLKNKNWSDDKEEVETQRELSYLDWLDRVETLISDEEKALGDSTEDLVYLDRLVSTEKKLRLKPYWVIRSF